MKRTISKIKIIGVALLSITLIIGLIASSTSAMVDPAASYCSSLGYEHFTGLTKKGERALCRLPNDQIVDAQQFLEWEGGIRVELLCYRGLCGKTC